LSLASSDESATVALDCEVLSAILRMLSAVD
jgi:hypothetical protein